MLLASVSFAQKELKSIDTTLKKIDSTFTKIDSSLKSIDENVGTLKDELVKEDTEPYNGQSIFEDRKGASAIFLPYGGIFRLNTADASLKLSFVDRVSTRKLFYGLDIIGKTNDGIMSFISSGNISPGSKVNGIIGLQELFHNTNTLDGWLILKVGYEGASFKLFNSDSLFANQIKKTSFNTFTSSLSLNVKIGGNKIFAASIGYQKVNNYEDLDDLELTDQKIIKDTVSNITRTYEKKTKVKVGDYKTFDQVPINVDFYWYPSNMQRIGIYHYWRTKFTNGKATNGFGSGLYLLKKDKPLSSIAGIVFEVNDISKLNDGFSKNFTINFVVAYNFSFTKRN
jgi:hypothetical protein